jgi:hypothetical protein
MQTELSYRQVAADYGRDGADIVEKALLISL